MKSNLLKAYLTVFATFMCFFSKAQPVDPPADPDPLPAPIDSQIIWLVIAAILIGYYVIQKNKVITTK